MHSNFTRIASGVAMALGLNAGLAQAASVNGVTIPDSAVTTALQQARVPDTPQARQAITQQLIARELFRQEANKDKSLEQRVDVQKALREAKEAILTQAWLKEHIKATPVTDAQVKERYDTIVGSLGDQEYKPRLIQTADEAAAKAALARIKGGEDFAKVAQEVSTAPSKASGGQLDWVSFKVPAQEGKTQSLPMPIAQALVALPPGGVTATPVAWEGRYYLLKLDAARPTQIPAFDAVKASIQQALQAQALERATTTLVTQMLTKAKITQ